MKWISTSYLILVEICIHPSSKFPILLLAHLSFSLYFSRVTTLKLYLSHLLDLASSYRYLEENGDRIHDT